ERAGFRVERFTIRRTSEAVADRPERAEQRRTTALLDGNRRHLLLAIVRRFMRRPIGTARALGKAIGNACREGVSLINLVRGLAYFSEAASLAEQLERLRVRHVHVHFGTNPATVARLAARMAPLTFSFTVHGPDEFDAPLDRKSTRLNSSHVKISYAVFCLKKKKRKLVFITHEEVI